MIGIKSSHKATHGQVIFLNGPSSAGKTSIAKLLQTKLVEPYLHIGIDNLIDMMPAHLNDWEGDRVEQGFWWKQEIDKDGQPVYHIQTGDYAKKICCALPELVVTLLDQGFNVIVDEICIDQENFNHWKKKLASYQVLYVGVHASIETLEDREKARQNRIIGSARAQHSLIHQDKQYCLVIDTSEKNIEDCVDSILAVLNEKK